MAAGYCRSLLSFQLRAAWAEGWRGAGLYAAAEQRVDFPPAPSSALGFPLPALLF